MGPIAATVLLGRYRTSVGPYLPDAFSERRRTNSANRMSDVTKTSTTVDTAVTIGLTLKMASTHICLGNVGVWPPLTNSAMVSSSSEITKANRYAAIRPGKISGKVT